MTAVPRHMLGLTVLIVVFSSTSTAYAQDSVSITSPSGNPTWVAGNGETVAAFITGNTQVSTVRVTIYDTANPGDQYYSNTSNYNQFWFLNFTCPNPDPGSGYTLWPSTVKVEAIGTDGVTVVGSSTAPVTIAAP